MVLAESAFWWATGLVFLIYLAAALSLAKLPGRAFTLDPAKIAAGPFGRASLANFQVLFFSVIVLWLAIHWLVKNNGLIEFHESLLVLLGITAAGTAGAKVTDNSRTRISFENWAWLKERKWIEKDITPNATDRKPRWGDLFVTEQGFEVARFQAVAFSLVIGVALLVKGVGSADALASFKLPDTYLVLMGLSQAMYVGGKAVGSSSVSELNSKLNEVRELEKAYAIAVAQSAPWAAAAANIRTRALADQSASKELVAFTAAVNEAAVMLTELSTNVIGPDKRLPNLP